MEKNDSSCAHDLNTILRSLGKIKCVKIDHILSYKWCENSPHSEILYESFIEMPRRLFVIDELKKMNAHKFLKPFVPEFFPQCFGPNNVKKL